MPTNLDPGGDRVEACFRAVVELQRRYSEECPPKQRTPDGLASGNFVAKQTGIRQQNISNLLAHRSIGIEIADKIASLYETTVDGLVWLFLHEGQGAVRAGDIPHWAQAVAAARDQYGEVQHSFELAAEVRLPIAPKRATKEFAQELAHLIWKHGLTSHMRVAATPSNTPSTKPPGKLSKTR
jgi:hypothetical protein